VLPDFTPRRHVAIVRTLSSVAERHERVVVPLISDEAEQAMKYLCLVYLDEKTFATTPGRPSDAECFAFGEGIRESGRYIAAEALQPVKTGKTVRVRNGKASITDGPFAETKEQLGGFYLIEAANLDEALQLAAKIPPARVGSIEVRPIRELEV
jgi:hypothetical protein